MKKLFLMLVLVPVLISFLSCASKQIPRTRSASNDLEQRVTLLWSARVNQNWDQVYDLMDTEYQKTHSKAAFVAIGELKPVLEFDIIEIEPVSENHSDVFIKFKIEKMGAVFSPTFKERWVFEKSHGWRLFKTGMIGKNPF